MSIDLIEMELENPSSPKAKRGVGVDRRGAPRFAAVEDRVWLGWWDGEQFRTLGCLLLDVSRTGAAIACPDGPGEGEDAWFCVVRARMSGGARARVVGRDPLPDDSEGFRLRLTFQPRCPDDVYEVALGLLNG